MCVKEFVQFWKQLISRQLGILKLRADQPIRGAPLAAYKAEETASAACDLQPGILKVSGPGRLAEHPAEFTAGRLDLLHPINQVLDRVNASLPDTGN
ncbi:hypothetical protein [Stenotrophomonas rhizophila]|uniref:hypothetical protein n=1 Tax=Stenotrophomonas rhizophila TaxID=216778 RepID=UPI0028A70828|nr:hypothetical protein [Stenotrophomonas rhizophila]